MRYLFTTLLTIISLLFAGDFLLKAQTPQSRKINSAALSEGVQETLFSIVANQPLSYITRENEGIYQLIIPRAGESIPENRVYNGRFVMVQTERRGSDAVFIFYPANQSSFSIKNNNSNAQGEFVIEVRVSSAPRKNAAEINNSNVVKTPLQTSVIKEGAVKSTNAIPIPPDKTFAASSKIEVKEARIETDKGKVDSQPANDAAKVTQSRLQITRVSGAPVLEDFINKRAGYAGTEVSDFRQLAPEDGAPATQPTKAYLSYDNSNLYVVFVCAAERRKIRANMAKREDIFNDDMVTLVLDTFQDGRRAYQFSANPFGVQLDGITTEGQGTDFTFDTLWYSDGRLTDDGYVVLMQIPFKSLRFSNSAVQSWGIALGRTIAHNSEEVYYPHITQRRQGFIQQAATLEGIREISQGRNIQIIPYYVASTERSLDALPDNTPYFRRETGVRIGADAKIVLKDAFTLDLTVNPDFSQVESDEPQVTVNRRFENFFPEKRPFFIENAGFFVTPENLFFSRRIVDPQFGARLTGKAGKWAIGGLVIDDKAPGRFFLPNEFEYGKRAIAGVFRGQREFGEQSSVGVLITNYNFASSSNTILAIDNRLRLNDNWSFTGQYIRSYTKERGGRFEAGSAFTARLSRSGRNFNYDLIYTDRSPNFNAALGFIPRVDIRQIEKSASYRWRPNKKGIASFGPTGFALANWDHRGTLQDWHLSAGFGVEFTNLTGFDVNRSRTYELFFGQGFYTENTSVSFYTDSLKWLGVYGSFYWGTGVNYSTPLNLDPFKASSSGASIDLTFRPSSQLSFKQTYIYSRLATLKDDLLLGYENPASIYFNHIFRSKLNYQFNRRLSLRAIVDYNAVLPNFVLIDLENDKRFTGDILLTYMINPWTAINVGYTDTYENLILNSGAPRVLLRTQSPFNPVGRRFFIKVNNLFRF